MHCWVILWSFLFNGICWLQLVCASLSQIEIGLNPGVSLNRFVFRAREYVPVWKPLQIKIVCEEFELVCFSPKSLHVLLYLQILSVTEIRDRWESAIVNLFVFVGWPCLCLNMCYKCVHLFFRERHLVHVWRVTNVGKGTVVLTSRNIKLVSACHTNGSLNFARLAFW